MKRLLIVGALVVSSAFTYNAFGAHAATCAPDAGAGTVCVGGSGPSDGYIEANGNDSNPCPLGGYLAVDGSGVSGSADPGTGYSPGTNMIIPPASGSSPTAPCQ